MSKLFLVPAFTILWAATLFAMEQQQSKTLTHLDENVLRTIARYVDHNSCAHAREACTHLNTEFWNDAGKIYIWPDHGTRDDSEEQFWCAVLAKINAAEIAIKKFNPNLDTKKVELPNAIALKIGWFRHISTLSEGLMQTSCVRSLDLSCACLPVEELAKLSRLLPLLYELKIIGNTLGSIPKNFAQWASLRRLLIGGNCMAKDSLNESLPRQLEYLDISHFGYQEIPEFLKEMTRLKSLNLAHNRQFLVNELSKLPVFLPQLEELDLSNCGLCVVPFEPFGLFKKLLRLYVYENDLNVFACLDRLPFCLPKLEVLDLGQNGLPKLPHFSQFKKLKKLNLARHPGGDYECRERENHFSPQRQEEIREMLPQTKIIF